MESNWKFSSSSANQICERVRLVGWKITQHLERDPRKIASWQVKIIRRLNFIRRKWFLAWRLRFEWRIIVIFIKRNWRQKITHSIKKIFQKIIQRTLGYFSPKNIIKTKNEDIIWLESKFTATNPNQYP